MFAERQSLYSKIWCVDYRWLHVTQFATPAWDFIAFLVPDIVHSLFHLTVFDLVILGTGIDGRCAGWFSRRPFNCSSHHLRRPAIATPRLGVAIGISDFNSTDSIEDRTPA